jgi:hypothetical protein
MGIKGLSETFKYNRVVKLKDLANKTVAIDAMTEIYSASLGTKSISTLTDKHGNNTNYINVLLYTIINFHKANIKQIWIFDNNKTGHNPEKLEEQRKRSEKRQAAKAKLDNFDKLKELFSDDDNDNNDNVNDKTAIKASLEKQTFHLTDEILSNVLFMLNSFNISYLFAPEGFEAEQIASYLSATDQVDGVYSRDVDPIVFGAKILWRKESRIKKGNKEKRILEYTQESIFKQIGTKTPFKDLRKICVILGGDYAKKTKGIGPKTVLKKYKEIALTKEQKQAIIAYKKTPQEDMETYNFDKIAFNNCNYDGIKHWLIHEKSFNMERIDKLFNKSL